MLQESFMIMSLYATNMGLVDHAAQCMVDVCNTVQYFM